MISPASNSETFLTGAPGPDMVREYFRRCRARGRLSHAYLFSGPPSSGKGEFARALARALFCEGGQPCEVCPSCLAAEHDNHGSIHELGTEDKRAIDVADVRELSRQDRRSRSGLVVWILNEVERMSVPAMNALLKTLEEPRPGALLLLTTQSVGSLLPTIVSRCHRVPFQGQAFDRRDSEINAQGELFALPASSDFYSRHDSRDWLELLTPGISNRRAAVGKVLDDLIQRVHASWLEAETGSAVGCSDPLASLETLLRLREDLGRNVNADLVLESLIDHCKTSVP